MTGSAMRLHLGLNCRRRMTKKSDLNNEPTKEHPLILWAFVEGSAESESIPCRMLEAKTFAKPSAAGDDAVIVSP